MYSLQETKKRGLSRGKKKIKTYNNIKADQGGSFSTIKPANDTIFNSGQTKKHPTQMCQNSCNFAEET